MNQCDVSLQVHSRLEMIQNVHECSFIFVMFFYMFLIQQSCIYKCTLNLRLLRRYAPVRECGFLFVLYSGLCLHACVWRCPFDLIKLKGQCTQKWKFQTCMTFFPLQKTKQDFLKTFFVHAQVRNNTRVIKWRNFHWWVHNPFQIK